MKTCQSLFIAACLCRFCCAFTTEQIYVVEMRFIQSTATQRWSGIVSGVHNTTQLINGVTTPVPANVTVDLETDQGGMAPNPVHGIGVELPGVAYTWLSTVQGAANSTIGKTKFTQMALPFGTDEATVVLPAPNDGISITGQRASGALKPNQMVWTYAAVNAYAGLNEPANKTYSIWQSIKQPNNQFGPWTPMDVSFTAGESVLAVYVKTVNRNTLAPNGWFTIKFRVVDNLGMPVGGDVVTGVKIVAGQAGP